MEKVKEIKVYNTDEAAEILHVSRQTVYNYIKEGKLKAKKIGKEFRITHEELERFVSE